MRNLKFGLTSLLCLILQMGFLQAQIQKGDLKKGKTASAEISPNEKHHYTVTLGPNQYAFFRLMQQGVDMKITTYDPAGNKLEDFDSPNGRQGPELFSITSSKKGKYKVEISPFDEKEPKGIYAVEIKSIKPQATTPNEQVDELFTPWDSDDTPGASVAVVKDGAIIYKKGYGMANLEYDIPNTPSTIFHIASVSKQFTAFSILLLEKEGRLSLDDDLRKYIPEVPDFGKTITLRHLATHTSGMRDQWNLLAMAGWRLDDVITKEHVLKLVSKQKELNFNPGDEYLYCNTGFTLLAEVVARVSGQSFAEFTQAKIFGPLQMNNTLFYDDHEKIVKNRAYSYYEGSEGFKKSVLSYANVGATSLFTTVEDLSLWSLNFAKPKVGDQGIIDKLNTLAVLNNGKTFGGALGQFVGKYKGLNEIQHGGADAGYRTYLTRFPDENFSVVVFSNSAQFNSGRMAHQVVDIYLKDKIKEAPKKEEPKEEKPTEEVEIAPQTLATYVGKYELQPGFIIAVQEKEEGLEALATGQAPVNLEPISLTKFQVVGVEATLEFVPNDEEKVQVVKLTQGGRTMEAKRIKDFDENAVKLSAFTGAFYSEELATTYHFTVEDEKLVAKHSRLSDITLNPSKKDVFSGSTWYFGQITFVRDAEGQITGCKVSNGRVRNLHFEKMD
ncbi:MAG: beta-lactamase family protein [Saprospiraceae bacterium]|nr:beta-lactamase family protein [Saprospiraceae bacterium]